jgi:hypothetical protein
MPSLDETLFAQDLKMLAAVKLSRWGVSPRVAPPNSRGVTRVEFLLSLRDYQVSPFRLDAEELRRDVFNA